MEDLKHEIVDTMLNEDLLSMMSKTLDEAYEVSASLRNDGRASEAHDHYMNKLRELLDYAYEQVADKRTEKAIGSYVKSPAAHITPVNVNVNFAELYSGGGLRRHAYERFFEMLELYNEKRRRL